MRVLLTGATGYIGTAVLEALVALGHEVVGAVRDPSRAQLVLDRGGEPVVADLAAPDAMQELAHSADGVIHLASPGDDTGASIDEAVVTGVLAGLAGSGKPFVYTAGIWDHGSGSDLHETSVFRPPRITTWRPAITGRVRGAEGIRGVVISPAFVHGRGEGLLQVVAGAPLRGGGDQSLTVLGSGEQHWATVHVDDLADLYVLALRHAPAGTYLIGASGANPTALEVTAALSRARHLHGRVEAEGLAATMERLGGLGEALLLDQTASGDGARRLLGWQPRRPTLLERLAGSAR
jgi:nucleoside-diphosphate-sugar epimerase